MPRRYCFPRVPVAATTGDESDSGRWIFDPDLPGRKLNFDRPSTRTDLQAWRRAISSQKKRNGISDMSTHFLPCERFKPWRDQPEVVGDNCPERVLRQAQVRGSAIPRAERHSQGSARVRGERWPHPARKKCGPGSGARTASATMIQQNDSESARVNEIQQTAPESAQDLARRTALI
jgi:hypothetical protein